MTQPSNGSSWVDMPPLEKKEIESKNVASTDIKWRRREGSDYLCYFGVRENPNIAQLNSQVNIMDKSSVLNDLRKEFEGF